MKRQISVFIASPSDLAAERQAFKKAIHELNIGFGDGRDVEFIPLGWEDTLATTGRRNQSVINSEIDKCDVFILTLYRRWGQNYPDNEHYTSYTEEEFHRALELWKKTGIPEIFVFFKRVGTESEADPGPQLEKVMQFRQRLEDSRQVLYHYFDNEQGFIDEVDQHLRAYAKDELPKTDQQRESVILPTGIIETVAKAQAEAKKKAKEAEAAKDAETAALLKTEALQLEMAEDAAKLSKEGKIEFARQKFAKLMTESTNLRVLHLSFEFFYRTGDLNAAQSTLKKSLNLSQQNQDNISLAITYGNLGVVYQTRGELEQAEAMHQKALTINESLGRKEGMANQYGNLGIVYQTRGELDRTEAMYKKALAIDESLGHQEGMASDYGNLGIVYKARGELDQAEAMYQKSLAINESLDRKEGMAKQYGNLGTVYQIRGELDQAEAMYQKSLAINESLGRKEGMAKQYGNLGTVYQTRGELDQAEAMHQKALAIDESLGRKEGMANQYGNLGIVYQARGELDQAEAMYQKSLAIDESLGRKEGMANQYGNLGIMYQIRGELDQASELFEKSQALFTALGSPLAETAGSQLTEIRQAMAERNHQAVDTRT